MPVATLACVVIPWAAGCEAQGKRLRGSCAIRGSQCGKCGRTMQTGYSGPAGDSPRYVCARAQQLYGTGPGCQSIGGGRLEKIRLVLTPGDEPAMMIRNQYRLWDRGTGPGRREAASDDRGSAGGADVVGLQRQDHRVASGAGCLRVRQSTPTQVQRACSGSTNWGNARSGWAGPAHQVVVIDTDLGRSGARTDGRLGFSGLVADVGLGKVGIVLGIEVSRLARNNADWYQPAGSVRADRHPDRRCRRYLPPGRTPRGCGPTGVRPAAMAAAHHARGGRCCKA
jgi:hypothetical protein